MEKKYSWLYKFAWGFEVAAALTGLAMAAVFAVGPYQRFSEDGINPVEMTLLIGGSLPFVMVAFAELCKIPLVIATVRANTKFTTILFGATTFAAAFITFETVYNGLEQTQAQRSIHIFKLNAELNNLENRIATIDNRISVASDKNETKVNSEITELREQARAGFKQRESIVEKEIKKIDKKFEEKYESVVVPLESQLEQLEKENVASDKDKNEEIELTKNNISTAQNSLSKYEKNLQQCGILSNNCKQLNLVGIANSRNKIEANERKLNLLMKNNPDDNVGITNISEKIKEAKKVLQEEKESELKAPNKKGQEARKWLQNELNKIDKSANEKKETLTDNQNKISKSQDNKDNLLNEIDNIKKEKALEVNANLVYRLAGRWFGVKAGEVTEAQSAIIGGIWSGSIAAIVAIMGPMIAGAYLMLNSQPKEKPKSSFRALAKAIRSQKRKPKIIKKMVEVEKLVEKEIFVEKTVEVEVEKLVVKHIPIFTDDPSLIELSKEWKK